MNKIRPVFNVISLSITCALLGTGCATIFHGSHGDLDINSDPAGAEIYINGEESGITPKRMELERNGSYDIEIRKEGYVRKTVAVGHGVGVGWVALDLAYIGAVAFATQTPAPFESADERHNREEMAPFSMIFSIVPTVVDAMTGKWNNLDRDQVDVILEKAHAQNENRAK